jgi:pyruvate/2-oxoglutarate/acetoin dehydrogenase E1 component
VGVNMKNYIDECRKAMNWLSTQPDTIFLGQTCLYDGSPMFKTLNEIPDDFKLEMPVAENMQLGISTGLSLTGFVPISIFPRMDFLICAGDQLFNHLDKMEEMSYRQWKPKVIIRTMIGNKKPLYPGPQHTGDYRKALKQLKNIKVVTLNKAEDIVKEYKKAYKRKRSTILIELPQGIKNAVYKK